MGGEVAGGVVARKSPVAWHLPPHRDVEPMAAKALWRDLVADSIFNAVILSRWDHVVGPRIIQVSSCLYPLQSPHSTTVQIWVGDRSSMPPSFIDDFLPQVSVVSVCGILLMSHPGVTLHAVG
jgi:hypothetical protein